MKDYLPGGEDRVFYVNGQTKIAITVEDDYCLYEMADNTIAAKNPGWNVDVITNAMWILKDEGGCPVETYHIKELS